MSDSPTTSTDNSAKVSQSSETASRRQVNGNSSPADALSTRECSPALDESANTDHLPYIDESEGSNGQHDSSDPLDLYELKETVITGSKQSLIDNSNKMCDSSSNCSNNSGQIKPTIPFSNGDSGIVLHPSDHERSVQGQSKSNWCDESSETTELPERLI